MNGVCYEGIGAVVVTMNTNEDIAPGTLVNMGPHDMVYVCEDGAEFCGVVRGSRFHKVQVQFQGPVRVKCKDGASVGWQMLVADGEGGVREAIQDDEGVWEANARKVLVLQNGYWDNHVVIWL